MKIIKIFKALSFVSIFSLASCKSPSPIGSDYGDDIEETIYVDPSSIVKEDGCFHTLDQLAFMSSSRDTVNFFADGTKDLSNPTGNIINFTKTGGILLQVSSFEDFHEDENTPYLDTRLFDIENHTAAKIKNLLSDTTYYWRTFDVQDCSATPLEEGSFKTCNHLPRFIDIDDISTTKYVTNVRDMGGYESYLEGYTKVKEGYIYRSGRMSGSTNGTGASVPNQKPVEDSGAPSMLMSEAGYNMLMKTLGMKGEIDLRNDVCKQNSDGSLYVENGNRDKYPDIIPGLNVCVAGIFAEKSALLQDLDYMGLTSGYEQIKKVFKFYAQPQNYPNFVHCYIGTDRTGCMCYLLECLLGVSNEDMYRDYLWSNFGLINGTRDLNAIKTYERKLLSYGKDTMAENCEAFLTSSTIGLTKQEIQTIRDTLLVKAN